MHVLPAPDALDRALPEGHVCLLCGDDTPLTLVLTQALTSRGWRVVLWSPPESPEQIPLALASVAENHGPIAAYIHINPPDTGDCFSARDEALLKHTFLMAKYLKVSLFEAAQHGAAVFVAVTRMDGALGLTGNGSVVAGGLFGLVKTLALEWRAAGTQGVFCRAVDIAPTLDVDRAVATLLAELDDPNRRIVEVGWSETGRVTLSPD
ncbi:MAG: hypothetical protein JXA21_04310 [Anaerolineae bacterium]|nr:hypothetical protein [Anaerolineae bacterium]